MQISSQDTLCIFSFFSTLQRQRHFFIDFIFVWSLSSEHTPWYPVQPGWLVWCYPGWEFEMRKRNWVFAWLPTSPGSKLDLDQEEKEDISSPTEATSFWSSPGTRTPEILPQMQDRRLSGEISGWWESEMPFWAVSTAHDILSSQDDW